IQVHARRIGFHASLSHTYAVCSFPVHKPDKVSWVEAAGTIRDGLCVYTALHSLADLAPGKFVLVPDGASPLGVLAIQLSHHRGAAVIATAHSEEDKQYLEKLRPPV
ncbi:hypothetical protein GDO78_019394, partial [Eleutherodactylus coqui]